MIKADKLALFNEQLAGMLKAGIPLEGALRKTAGEIRDKKFAAEIDLLEADLAGGTPFDKAIAKRKLPDFYKQMLLTGSKADRLPEALTAVADYYRRRSEIFIRLSGLMVYPGLVLIGALMLSILTTFYWGDRIKTILFEMNRLDVTALPPPIYIVSQYFSIFVIVFLLVLYFFIIFCKPFRYCFSWLFAPFRDVNIANFANMISICLKSGMEITAALEFVKMFERGKVKRQLEQFIQNIKEGMPLDESLKVCKFLPATAQWLITSSGDKPEEGFYAVADIFNKRAQYKADILLYVSLPVSICFIAGVIIVQLSGYIAAVRQMFRMLFWY